MHTVQHLRNFENILNPEPSSTLKKILDNGHYQWFIVINTCLNTIIKTIGIDIIKCKIK